MCFIDDCLLGNCHCTHCGGQQHSVVMCQFIGQIKKAQFLIQLGQNHGILSVVVNELFKVLVVQLIQGAFVLQFAFTQFVLGDSVQAVAMPFFVGVFAVQLHIVQMHTTNQIKGQLLCTKTFKGTLLGHLIPQA